MRIIFFEGTPDEFKQVRPLLHDPQVPSSNASGASGTAGSASGTVNSDSGIASGPAGTAPGSSEGNGQDVAPGKDAPGEITQALLTRALTRIQLSENQRAVLQAVSEADDADGITNEELARKLGITGAQIAGVWGAMGRRFANTPRWPKNGYPYKQKWEGRQYRYWPTPTLRQVMGSGAV